MKWEHGVQFVCVAFQNRVAYQMGGATLHSAGEVPVGGVHQDRKLAHGDIDLLFTKNQALRWILIDEVYMIPDDLLGHFGLTEVLTAYVTLSRVKHAEALLLLRAFSPLLFHQHGGRPLPTRRPLPRRQLLQLRRQPRTRRRVHCAEIMRQVYADIS